VRGYRGGYLPNERREIERGLRDGTVRTVVSTNALELGIDIGGLDACVIVGYPGTIASTWQQAGRAGRRSGTSLAVIVASSAPLDQYIAHHPEYFLSRSPENGLLNPDNLYILASHVKCGAFELPFDDGSKLGAQPIDDLLGYLGDHQVLHHSGKRWYWSDEAFPAEEVSLRSASTDNIVIVDQTESTRPVVIGEMDRLGASTMLHDEAIYIHGGQQHEVLKLDWDEKKAYVRRVDVDYYTDAELAMNLEVLDQFAAGWQGQLQSAWGEAALTAMATIYKKIKLHTHENVGFGRIRLPEDNLHTSAYWLSLPLGVADRFTPPELQEALLGLGHVIANVAPLRLMCDPRDLGVHTQVRAAHTGLPTVYVYDGVPGGIGFAERLFETSGQLVESARELVTECACEAGCPSCVGVTMDPTLDGKSLTLRLLDVARSVEYGAGRG
jgi:DEAD/DEAH box helicase domain-containing protein